MLFGSRPARSAWSFRGKLHEEQHLFFEALARETGMHAEVFQKISQRLVSKYFRTTLSTMLQLTSLQMRQIISDCGGDTDWISSLEQMLDAKFASSVEVAHTLAVVEEKRVKAASTNLRLSKFMDVEDQTLGHYLYKNKLLEEAVLPEWVFQVVNTPEPNQR